MVCDEYMFLRIHIKKTGGRSLWHLFPEPDDSHAGFLEYRGNLGERIADYFVWTVVRNPWARFVSLFFYELLETGQAHTDDFKKFTRDIYDSVMRRDYRHYYDSKQQLDHLVDHTGQLAVDYVAFLPNISSDFEMVKRRCGLPDGMVYPHMGANPHRDYREYYDSESVRWVGEMQSGDVETFGFVFEDERAFRYPIPDCLSEPRQLGWRERLVSYNP